MLPGGLHFQGVARFQMQLFPQRLGDNHATCLVNGKTTIHYWYDSMGVPISKCHSIEGVELYSYGTSSLKRSIWAGRVRKGDQERGSYSGERSFGSHWDGSSIFFRTRA